MERLRDGIGSIQVLAICIDVGQGVMAGVKEVFPDVEHRECMLHLVMNFKKKYHGKIFDDHLW
jgi:transposase-like protein